MILILELQKVLVLAPLFDGNFEFDQNLVLLAVERKTFDFMEHDDFEPDVGLFLLIKTIRKRR